MALMALALIDFLRSEDSFEEYPEYEAALVKYLDFLMSLRLSNGQFYKSYEYESGTGGGNPSPYFDGEILLALVKARNHLDLRHGTDYCWSRPNRCTEFTSTRHGVRIPTAMLPRVSTNGDPWRTSRSTRAIFLPRKKNMPTGLSISPIG